MKAYRLIDWGRADYQEVPVPVPGPAEVLVRVGGVGLCGSDLHMIETASGEWPATPPWTLGHETAGWVADVGSGVRELEVGQAVIASGIHSCGQCRACRSGLDNLCPIATGGRGVGSDGGLAEFVVVPERELVQLGDLEPARVAPLADAGHTSYSALQRVRDRLAPGSLALVIGAGGLGAYAIQYLKLLTGAGVIAVDSSRLRLESALELGADAALLPDAELPRRVAELTEGRGADAVFDFVGDQSSIENGLASVAVAGAVLIVGLGGKAKVTLEWGRLPPLHCELSSHIGGTLTELHEVVELARSGRIRIETETFGFTQIPEALDRLAAGSLRGRAVVRPQS